MLSNNGRCLENLVIFFSTYFSKNFSVSVLTRYVDLNGFEIKLKIFLSKEFIIKHSNGKSQLYQKSSTNDVTVKINDFSPPLYVTFFP